MYKERMIGYYPPILSAILEFQAIIGAEYPEYERISTEKDTVVNDAYLLTMGEERVLQWERILGISPLVNSTLQDRRDTIVARIRGQGKLNTELINSIVNAFTGGTAKSWVEDSVLYVEINPPPGNKQYKFSNVEQEIAKKVPAHLGYKITRNYAEWSDIKDNFGTWEDVKTDLGIWTEVLFFIPTT